MAYVKIEPTGCTERKGMVQVRLSMYLESGDYGYNKKLPNNPFHNHFIYVDIDTTESEISSIAISFLNEAYTKWASDIKPDVSNSSLPFQKPETVDDARILACLNRANEIKTITEAWK